MEIVKGILLFAQTIISLCLVILVTTQTSKNEGFGSVGVQAPTVFKGKPGFEERMQGYKRQFAIAWFSIGLVLAFMISRF
jgi:protein translocase SecG subunit